MTVTDNMVDKNATPETKNLFIRLHAAARTGKSLIGMDSSTRFGEFLCPDPAGPKNWSIADPCDRTDIRDVCGRHPSIYGIDIADILGDWCAVDQDEEIRQSQIEQSREKTKNHIKVIHSRGGTVTLHYHMYNPIDDESFDTPPSELWQLVVPTDVDDSLPENAGAAFDKFRAKIDALVDFLEEVVDDDGKHIPVIFRPFHENNGDWFWWCPPANVDFEVYITAYRKVWQWMVWYIHDYRGYHAMLWATAPNGGKGEGGLTTSEKYWRTLPDPYYVDVIGYDRYTDYNAEDGQAMEEVRLIVTEAERLGKIPAVTEAGYTHLGDCGAWPEKIWSENVIGPIKNDKVARRVAWILLWHNFPNDDDALGKFFGPHVNHCSAGDFANVSQREDVLFENDLHTTELETEE